MAFGEIISGWDPWLKVLAGLAALTTILGGGLRIWWRITTAENRRLEMLHKYIEDREQNISGKRSDVLEVIKLSEHFQLEQKPLDVGGEIDEVVRLLDQDRLKQAAEALIDLEERLERKEKIVRKYADELLVHKASVHVFIAAVADRRKRTDHGLEHVKQALAIDKKDKDALKYQGWLLLRKKDLAGAEESFNKLRSASIGSENDIYRRDAWEGLGFAHLAAGRESYTDAERAFANAVAIVKQGAGDNKDSFARGRMLDALGDVYAASGWIGHDTVKAEASYKSAIAALNTEGDSEKERTARSRAVRAIEVKLRAVAALRKHAQPQLSQ